MLLSKCMCAFHLQDRGKPVCIFVGWSAGTSATMKSSLHNVSWARLRPLCLSILWIYCTLTVLCLVLRAWLSLACRGGDPLCDLLYGNRNQIAVDLRSINIYLPCAYSLLFLSVRSWGLALAWIGIWPLVYGLHLLPFYLKWGEFWLDAVVLYDFALRTIKYISGG